MWSYDFYSLLYHIPMCWLNLIFVRTFNTLWRCPCRLVSFFTKTLSIKLCQNLVTFAISLDMLGFFAPKLLPFLQLRLTIRLWLVKGMFLAIWALRYCLLPLVCRHKVNLYQFRVLLRIPQMQLLWILNRLLMMSLMVGLRWSFDRNQVSTSVTPLEGRKWLQLKLCLM